MNLCAIQLAVSLVAFVPLSQCLEWVPWEEEQGETEKGVADGGDGDKGGCF